jgi:hypothetical protein
MRRSERRKRGSFDFVKEGKLQKQAQIGRLRVRFCISSATILQLWVVELRAKSCTFKLSTACARTLLLLDRLYHILCTEIPVM